MHPFVSQVQIRVTIVTVKNHIPVDRLEGALDQRSGNEDPLTNPVNLRARLLENITARRLYNFHAGAFENAEGGLVDTL
jgi:hypothetical protein